MLKKKYRLNLAIKLSDPEFFKNSFFTLLVSKNNIGKSRFGFIASKRDDKRAVGRNRVKRVFSQILRSQNVKPGYDMIFLIKKESFQKTSEQISQKIDEVLEKGKLI
jgi:ribonuclease P protein component